MIVTLPELKKAILVDKADRKTVAYTSGCFDLIHAGHIESLVDAKRFCDILIVAVNSDASVKRLKGQSRPINNERDRSFIVSNLKPVTYVIINESLNNNKLISLLKPDVYVKSGEYRNKSTSEPIVASYGGMTVYVPVIDGRSTTNIIERIKNAG